MPYTRIEPSVEDYPWVVANNGITINSATTVCGFNSTRTGTSVPNYRSLIAEGSNATSEYVVDRSKLLTKVEGKISAFGIGAPPPPLHEGAWARGQKHETMRGFGLPEFSVLPHIIANTPEAEAMALTAVYRKIESEQSHLAGASVLAEGVDVLRQFGKPFDAVIDLTNRRLNRLDLERRGLKGTTSFKRIKWAQIVASTYLEYAFGLEPLISDTQKVAEAYARWHDEAKDSPKLRSRVTGRGHSNSVNHSAGHIRPGDSQCLRFRYTDRLATEDRVQYVCGLKATPIANIGSNDRLRDLLGFQPRKWIPAIWEVVPWSFLADYFTNIQEILEAAAADVSGVTWCSRTRSQRTVRHVTTVNDKDFAYEALKGLGWAWEMVCEGDHAGHFSRIRTSMQRAPATLSVPPLVINYQLGNEQMANVVAVLFARKPSASAAWIY